VKLCSTCESPLYSEVKYCPFCSTGTGTGKKPEGRAGKVAAPVTPVAPVRTEDAVPSQPQGKRVREQPAAPAPVVAPAPATPAAAPSAPPAQPPQAVQQASSPIPARGAPTSSPVETERKPAKKGGVGKWIVPVVILAGVFLYFKGKPDQGELACNAAFEQGNKALLAKDLAGARLQATTASGVCVGTSRSKAASLQAAIDAAENTSTGCLRNFRLIESHLDDHKLVSARAALNDLSSTCSADADAAAWRSKLGKAVATAQGAQEALRTALDNKDLAQARLGFQQLANANRENPDLPALKDEIDQLAAANAAAVAAAAEVAAPTPPDSPAAVATPFNIAPMPTVAAPRAVEAPRERTPTRRIETDNAPNPKAEMAAVFLRDAETALAQKKFDAARTYVDSARRMDPGNPRLDSLTQQIRDRERQVLQQETIIR